MHKIQQFLIALLACFYSSTLLAQVSVDIEIKGLSDELATNVRLFLSIEQQQGHRLLSEARLRRLHQKAPQEINNALRPFGYYRPVIKTKLTQVSPAHWRATYTIDPGPPLLIGQFNFTISKGLRQDPEFQKLVQNLPLKKGAVFNHLKYENIKASLAELAAERGYFKARFVAHRVAIDLNAYEARVYLNYDGGPRYRFGDVLLKQDVLAPDFLRRYIPFKTGSPYTLYELIDLQHALNDSDYFQTVEVSPGLATDDLKVPINVALSPRKHHRYTMGIGYGTDTGARAKFGVEVPRVNRRGHRFSADARLSEIGYSLTAQYRVPVLNPRTDQMIYSAGVINEKTDVSDSTIKTIGATLNRNHDRWREATSLNYQQEEYVIGADRGVSTLLIPGINWSRTWGRNFIYTLDGLRLDIGLRGATKKLISDTDFFQLTSGIKAITPLGGSNRIILRGNLGSTWTDDFHQLPSSVRFFAGGSQSVRGYAYQSLGPVDASGKVVGGKYLMVGSVELEHRLNNKWGLAVFYDGGNAIDNIDEKLQRGAGFGLRWQSPVGPVRIDVANAVSRPDHPWRLHISIGPDL